MLPSSSLVSISSMSSLIFRNLHHLRSCVRAFSPTHRNLHFLQIHPFSSSSLKTTPNQHSFIVNYLINSCGFPLEKALSASKYVNFEIPDKPDSVLAFFENHGFTKTQISILVRKFPPVIVCDPEKTLLPKLEFFKSKGVSSTDVAKILSSSPTVLKRSLENHVIPSFNFLKKIMGSEEATISAIKRFGRLLLLDLRVCVAPNIEFLREAGVPNENIMVLLKYQPRVFMTNSARFREVVKEVKEMGFNPLRTKFVIAVHAFRAMSKSTWVKKVEVFKKWGLSEDDILVAFGKHPWCMMASEHKIAGVMNFFVNKMGWESSLVARRPGLVSLSLEKRIIPRCEVYKVLLSKGLIKDTDISLTTMLEYPENLFLNRVLYRHKEEAPKLLKLYKEKLALAQ
ncbi:hypothetical protein CsSME_00033237 [Camellia sinensis var. sinensis]|nr:uncharacterized protein LOC114314112 [Camellia sinensis]XP_028116364.1 uncharacterized protein LOC114314112 [Camellia sinensis]XP_028116365.1 uncharacterized protein LOC114314112 [Camellia sinensis]XP_028116366.1 uncharacterized protein LOC114314112 [Camellia sinensis]